MFPSSSIGLQKNLMKCLKRHTDITNTEGLWALIECIMNNGPKDIKLFEKMLAKVTKRMLYLNLIHF
jgi:hypothetical protein